MSSDDTRPRYRKHRYLGATAGRAVIAALAMAGALSLTAGLASPAAAQNNVFVNQQLLNSLGANAVPYGQGFPPSGLPGQGFVGVPGGLLFPPQQQPRSTLTTPQAFGQPLQPGFGQPGFGQPGFGQPGFGVPFAQQGMPFYSGVQVYSATPRPPVTTFAQNQMGQAQAGMMPRGVVPPGTVPGSLQSVPQQIGQAPAPVPRPVAPRAETRSEPQSQAFRPSGVARSGEAPSATAPQPAARPAPQPAPPPRTNRTAPPPLPSQALAEREAQRAEETQPQAPAPETAPAVAEAPEVEDMGTDRNARTSAAPATPAAPTPAPTPPAPATPAPSSATPEPADTVAELQPIPPAPAPPPAATPPAAEPAAPREEGTVTATGAETDPSAGTTQQADARTDAETNEEGPAGTTGAGTAGGETTGAGTAEAESGTPAEATPPPAPEPAPAAQAEAEGTQTDRDQRAALPPEPAPEAEAALEPDLLARIVFTDGQDQVATDGSTALNTLAENLRADESQRIQLLAYAAGDSSQVNQARRLSLSRALAVRQFLIGQGIRSTRMDVRALGNNIPDGPPNRVDVVPAPR